MTETGSWLRPLAMLRFVGEDINAQSEAALNGHKHALGRHVRDKLRADRALLHWLVVTVLFGR